MERFSNISLKPYNTFSIDAIAREMYSFSEEKDLIELLEMHPNQPILILGGGSNLLITKPVDQVILKNEIKGIQVIDEDEESVRVKVGAGENWHQFVSWAVDHGFGGIENMALIPGTVGAAPMQNIGAYGVELKDTFVELEAIQLDNQSIHKFDHRKCHFGYRYSIFKGPLKGEFCITRVVFKLQKNNKLNTSYGAILTELQKRNIAQPTIKDIFETVIDIRRSKLPDPKKIGNGGSFFKNPIVDIATLEKIKQDYPKIPHFPSDLDRVKIPAGWLIEQKGWKGYRRDNIGVYPNHALVLVNWGNGSGVAIWELAQEIQSSVADTFGIKLEPEVNII